MQLEVLVGSEEPILFPLNKPRISVGSSEQNDVIIDSSKISRKHLVVTIENERYFVIDQGSTNGSFMNEERLIPGRKTEFTSFFPVRLGDNVLITLYSDDVDSGSKHETPFPTLRDDYSTSQQEATTQMSLKSLSDKAKTKNLVLERDIKRKARTVKKSAPIKKKRKPVSTFQIFSALILASAAYYTFFIREPKQEKKIAVVGEIIEEIKLPEAKPRFEVFEPTSLESLGVLINDLKCVTDVEKYLCLKILNDDVGNFGVTQVGSKLNIMVDGSYFFTQAKEVFPNSTDVNEQNAVAVALYVLNAIPSDLDENLLKDLLLNFALFDKKESTIFPAVSFAISVAALKELKSSLNFEKISAVSKQGLSALSFTDEFYKMTKVSSETQSIQTSAPENTLPDHP